MANKKQLQVTPAGTAIYPHLTSPDTKFDADGVYHVKINCPPSERVTELTATIDAAAASALADAKAEAKGKKPEKGKKPPNLELCDDLPYTKEGDGSTTFSLKMKASGKKQDGTPWTMKPGIFDSKGTPIIGPIAIGGGTLMKGSFALDPFYTPKLGAGATLRLYAVQIIKLVEFSGRSAEGYGFEQEDGFEVDSVASVSQEAGFESSDDEPAAASSDTSEQDEF